MVAVLLTNRGVEQRRKLFARDHSARARAAHHKLAQITAAVQVSDLSGIWRPVNLVRRIASQAWAAKDLLYRPWLCCAGLRRLGLHRRCGAKRQGKQQRWNCRGKALSSQQNILPK